eukprot:scaffold254386_cov22-Tisochrysis_lutea.AAC.2
MDFATDTVERNEKERAAQMRGVIERLGPAYVKVGSFVKNGSDDYGVCDCNLLPHDVLLRTHAALAFYSKMLCSLEHALLHDLPAHLFSFGAHVVIRAMCGELACCTCHASLHASHALADGLKHLTPRMDPLT